MITLDRCCFANLFALFRCQGVLFTFFWARVLSFFWRFSFKIFTWLFPTICMSFFQNARVSWNKIKKTITKLSSFIGEKLFIEKGFWFFNKEVKELVVAFVVRAVVDAKQPNINAHNHYLMNLVWWKLMCLCTYISGFIYDRLKFSPIFAIRKAIC